MDIHDAIILATEAHNGQKDKLGVDYIHHPLQVMLAMATDEAVMAAQADLVEVVATLKQVVCVKG